MRYKTLVEVAGKYGLTVDLDEKASLSEWESRLIRLLEGKRKELPHARNPSLRHKVERECAEIQDAFKFVSQQSVFTKLRRCVEEDKQEIFEHELKKPDTRSILPTESDAEYEQYLELKVAARKKWPNIPFQAAAANPSPQAPSNGEKATPAPAAPIAQPALAATEPGRSGTVATTPLPATGATALEPSKPTAVKAAEVFPGTPRPEPITLPARTDLAPANSASIRSEPVASSSPTVHQLVKNDEKTLPVTLESARQSLNPTAATEASSEKTAEQKHTILAESIVSAPAPKVHAGNGHPTETTTGTQPLKQASKIPIKREHVSAALDILVKLRALMGLGGSFSMAKIIGTALAVFLIAVAGLITELTRERSRQNEKQDTNAKAPTHEESRVIPGGSPSPEPSRQSPETAKLSSEPAKQSAEPPRLSSESAKQPPDVARSDVAKPPVETSAPPVVIAQQQEPTRPEPPPETKTVPPPKPKMQLALLRIESTPPDATISIRGTRQPLKTPAEFNLPPGDYDVALALDCYSSVSTTLHLDGGDNRVLNRELQSLQPALTVRTAPPGAKIYVDGTLRNQLTPATVSGIEAGDRWVTVELAGYRSQNMAVKAKCGETVPVDFGKLQRPTARVSITSNARGASVWIDGADSGQLTPCSVELPLGSHRVRLVGPHGYRPEEKSVFLQDEDSVRLDVPLTPELIAMPANNSTRLNAPQENIPAPNLNLLVWCGLDYSMVKMIGTSRDFPPAEIFPNSVDRRGHVVEPMTSAWNDLFMKEMYPRLSRDLGATVQADLHAIQARNSRVGPQQIVDENSSPTYPADNGNIFNPTRLLRIGRGDKVLPTHISDADIAAAIRSYRMQTRSGLGLVFIMDRLVKKQETGCMYVVFFDIASRTIISQERVCTDAGGGGIRNHWFGAVKETVKRLPAMYQDAKLKR